MVFFENIVGNDRLCLMIFSFQNTSLIFRQPPLIYYPTKDTKRSASIELTGICDKFYFPELTESHMTLKISKLKIQFKRLLS